MLVAKYTIFAIISSLVSLFFQWLSFFFYSGAGSLYVAMSIGVLAALATKYTLDKKWIFCYTPLNKKDEMKKFIGYSFMGVFTTVVFVVIEMSFYYLLPYDNAKYIGVLIGLVVGYTMKYFLDKRYVFVNKITQGSSGEIR